MKSSTRALLGKSNAELAALLDHGRDDPEMLRQLADELGFRNSRTAAVLRKRVMAALDARSRSSTPVSPAQHRSGRASSNAKPPVNSATEPKRRDRKRTFSLPAVGDLTKEQEGAIRVPDDGQCLVVGGPGTGKTVVTLLRARRHARSGGDYKLLVWNHLLHMATGQLFGGNLSSATWEAWLMSAFRTRFRSPLPRIPGRDGYPPIDWKTVVATAERQDPVPQSQHLIIDEGQDMPPEFYRTIIAMGFERLFVAADQNQQISESHSGRQDIETELALDPGEAIELKQNYRNTGPIAKLARHFYTDPASPPPEIPSARGETARLFTYDNESLPSLCESIVRWTTINPRYLIGVLTPNNAVREKYVSALQDAAARLDSDHGEVQTFHNRHKPTVRFDEGGILAINAQACKGLEFDVVFLADIDEHFAPDTDLLRKRFYVMVARARKQVVLLRRRGYEKHVIDEILPKDSSILKRENT